MGNRRDEIHLQLGEPLRALLVTISIAMLITSSSSTPKPIARSRRRISATKAPSAPPRRCLTINRQSCSAQFRCRSGNHVIVTDAAGPFSCEGV